MPQGRSKRKVLTKWGLFDYTPWGYAETALKIGALVIGLSAPAGFVRRKKAEEQYAAGAMILILAIILAVHFYDRIQFKCVLAFVFLIFNTLAHLILGICLFAPVPVSAVFLLLFSGLGMIAQGVKIVDFTIGKFLDDIEADDLWRKIMWADCIFFLVIYFITFWLAVADLASNPIPEA